MLKVLGYVIASVAMVALAIVVIGFLLPEKHSVSVRTRYDASPQQIYDAIVDVERGPEWRSGLDSVQVLERAPLKWRESAEWGKLTMVMDEATPPSRVVSRIADQGEGFGGTWTYVITPGENGTGSLLLITEDGEVYNPLFRFMSKFVFGHYTSLETYAKDLGHRFNETVQPARSK
jgi:uncharacterized protein YndB with AHSA1/START domain